MMKVAILKEGNGFRSQWEQMTTAKWIIVIGGLFWATFTLAIGLYNYCAIQKPPPAVSFEESLCAEEEALIPSAQSQKSAKSSKKSAKN